MHTASLPYSATGIADGNFGALTRLLFHLCSDGAPRAFTAAGETQSTRDPCVGLLTSANLFRKRVPLRPETPLELGHLL